MSWVAPDDPIAATASVIDYAKTNGIKIYTVGLGSDVNGAELLSYATQTGGKYYAAPSPSQLAGIYKQIAGDLLELAGGDTVVTLDFGTVNINGVPSTDLTDYMEYVPDVHSPARTTDSTYLNKTNLTPSGTMHFYDGYPKSQDDSTAWLTAPHILQYNVGNVSLNDTWSSTFRLNLTHAGTVELFDPANPSKICFTDASTKKTVCQSIPPLKCNIQQQIVNVPFGNFNLLLENPVVTSSGLNPNIFTIMWDITYTGEKGAQETISYKNMDIPNSHYTAVPNGILSQSKCDKKPSSLTIDATSWPAGSYSIQVSGLAYDANTPLPIEGQWLKQGGGAPIYIKLE